ncbi:MULTISPECIES: hypothetical protein [unclassified Streptomyces]|uniref:hypothetical protein n=1 Tax=unclassified Streptomyces TaxID=2593676 RepID=UPI002E804252|nr:hypothetical protein [Streptomyces sp. NBC_00562]WTD31082.1 hypothetical protein OHB03_01780 [Streptomyces sp. NBC_01643]WUC17745.1 hypothetical protein OHA33_01990 [Streptomyces sp. NBC_00562]
MPTYDFPQDLRDAQLALHETRAQYEQYARTLPWSAEPMPGWESEKQPYTSFRSGKTDSPGYTDEQAAEIARLKARILELGTIVSTHPFWSSVESGVVDARMALKHVHKQSAEA